MVHPIATTSKPLTDHEAKLTRQAERLVGQTFYGTLLKQMHESPFKSKLMDGGRGGEAFQPLMDQHLIDHMSHSAGRKLVKSIVKHITGTEKAKAKAADEKAQSGAGEKGYSGESQSRDGLPNGKSAYPNAAAKYKASEAEREMRSHVPPGLRA